MDSRFTTRVLIADGTLNHSQPRTDGKRGTAMYGTLHLNLQHPEILAAIAAGQPSVQLDLSVWERTRGDATGTFFGLQWDGVYRPDAAKKSA